MGAVPNFGVSPQGFTLMRLADILSAYVAALETITDPVTGETLTPNLSNEADPLVQLMAATADSLAVCWEQLQMLYAMFDPLTSTGAAFSGLVQLNAITRLPGSYSTVTLNLTGTPNFTMAAGAQAGTQDGTMVFNLPQVVFDSSGNATGIIGVCTVLGPGPNAERAGTVTQMVTPVNGWGSVTNPAAVTMGTAEETDEQLRVRQQISTSNTAGTIIEAWASALANIDGIAYARIYQNVTGSTDARGVPAYNVAPVVMAETGINLSTDTALQNIIAQTIMSKLSVCATYGNTTVTLTDALGTEYAIEFTIPTVVPIYVALTVSIINSQTFPSNGATLIQDAIIAFATSGMDALGITSSYDQQGYVPGQSVNSSDLYAAIMTIPGIAIISCYVGTGSNPTTQSVNIPWNEVASFIAANISVTT